MRSDEQRAARLGRPESDFMQIVEAHEREWGTKRYRGRASLVDILNAHILAVWRTDDDPFQIFTIHASFRELDIYFYKMLFRPKVEVKQIDRRKLVRVYQDQQRMVAKNLRIDFIPVQP